MSTRLLLLLSFMLHHTYTTYSMVQESTIGQSNSSASLSLHNASASFTMRPYSLKALLLMYSISNFTQKQLSTLPIELQEQIYILKDTLLYLKCYNETLDLAHKDKIIEYPAVIESVLAFTSPAMLAKQIKVLQEHAAVRASQGLKFFLEHGVSCKVPWDTRHMQQTPLHLICMDESHIPSEKKINALYLLLNNKADINAKDTGGRTPLYYAIQEGKAYLVEHLLSQGAHVNVQDEHGNTPLHMVGFTNLLLEEYIQITQTLLEHGADPTQQEIWMKFTPRKFIETKVFPNPVYEKVVKLLQEYETKR